MTRTAASRLDQAYLIRTVEEQLLRLFAEGRVAGTTHTCIGQEMSAVALAEGLDREHDTIVSNHRCHGHYLAWTDDVDGLIAEVMGKRSGVCGGIGGSQHLHSRGFFSNGIQGGGTAVSAGLAFAQKLSRQGGIVAACIGDGTLGEGIVYETFNIAAKWQLPLLIVLENNLYAQSTAQVETLSGDIDARAKAFGIATFHGDTWNVDALAAEMRRAAGLVRSQSRPAFIRVDTYRLAAHSKGDDDRDPKEIADYASRDPLNLLLAQRLPTQESMLTLIKDRVARAVTKAESEESSIPAYTSIRSSAPAVLTPVSQAPETQLEAIRNALREWLTEDETVVLLGEDIRSPYGGAFKVTKGLSDAFPDRILNTPISEAAIIGVGNGLALGGHKPIVEIMFGDFLSLGMDQLLNHAAKFHAMYGNRVTTPLIVRTPMGAGRGYGPTHSQNLEKHFVGIPGLRVLVLHGRTRVDAMYRELRSVDTPTLLIENKLLYRERGDTPLPPGYSMYECGDRFAPTLLKPPGKADLTLVAFGRMSVLAERVAARLAAEEEVLVELIFPLQVSPLDSQSIVASAMQSGRVMIVEEGATDFDLASEVIASVTLAVQGRRPIAFRRLAAAATAIPSAQSLEKAVLPNESTLMEACLELFDG
jgi:2-oxoisovalerate dehydrogenase E1 component